MKRSPEKGRRVKRLAAPPCCPATPTWRPTGSPPRPHPPPTATTTGRCPGTPSPPPTTRWPPPPRPSSPPAMSTGEGRDRPSHRSRENKLRRIWFNLTGGDQHVPTGNHRPGKSDTYRSSACDCQACWEGMLCIFLAAIYYWQRLWPTLSQVCLSGVCLQLGRLLKAKGPLKASLIVIH
jgi:hypothetical protein